MKHHALPDRTVIGTIMMPLPLPIFTRLCDAFEKHFPGACLFAESDTTLLIHIPDEGGASGTGGDRVRGVAPEIFPAKQPSVMTPGQDCHAAFWEWVKKASREPLDPAVETLVMRAFSAGWKGGFRAGEPAIVKKVDERDACEEMLDLMTAEVARITGKPSGDHSNLNSPWDNALNCLKGMERRDG